MAVGDIWLLEWIQSVRGQPGMNVFQYEETEATGVPYEAASQLGDAFLNSCAADWAQIASEDWRTDGVYVRRVAPIAGVPASIVLGTAESIVGVIDSEAIPMTSAAVVTRRTLNGSRRSRGRWYGMGIPESSQNAGQLTTAAMLAINTQLTNFGLPLNGAGGDGAWKPVIYSSIGPDPGLNDVVILQLNPNLGTIRNRRSPARASDA